MNWNYEEGHIYSTNEKGEIIAETTFTRKNDREVDIDHTYVAPELRGKGIAGNMMTAVAEYLRKRGIKATASCSYANVWLQRNINEYKDIISEDLFNQEIACKIDSKY